MQHTLMRSATPLLIAAAIALGGCQQKPESFNTGTLDPMAAEVAQAPKVELPPMLKASKTYRCKDNGLVYVDFMADDLTAHFKSEKEGAITNLKAPEKGQAFVSEDGAVKVEGAGPTVTVTAPGKPAQSCKG